MAYWKDPDFNKTYRALIAPVSAVLLEYFTLVVLEGNIPKNSTLSVKETIKHKDWNKPDRRKRGFVKRVGNPYFFNEVLTSQSIPDPYYYHINITSSKLFSP